MLPKLSSEGLDANMWYGLAYTIVNAFTILPGAFMMGAMFPMLSRAWEREKGRFPGAYTFGMRWMVLCGFSVSGRAFNTISRNYGGVISDLRIG